MVLNILCCISQKSSNNLIRFSENTFIRINDLFQLLLHSPIKGKLHFTPLRNTNLFSKGTSLTMLIITSTLIIKSQRSCNPPYTGQILMKIHLLIYFFSKDKQQFGT